MSSSVGTGESFLATEQPELEAENGIFSVAFNRIYVVLNVVMGGTSICKEAALAYSKLVW
jgi:hypothetical protein